MAETTAKTVTKGATTPATKPAAKPVAKAETKPAGKAESKPATKPATKTKMIRIQYYRSKNSTPFKHKAVVKGLGFTRLNQIVERVDTESTRGMVKAIPHLVRIVED
jgi:large subunit ribosomal protein L30